MGSKASQNPRPLGRAAHGFRGLPFSYQKGGSPRSCWHREDLNPLPGSSARLGCPSTRRPAKVTGGGSLSRGSGDFPRALGRSQSHCRRHPEAPGEGRSSEFFRRRLKARVMTRDLGAGAGERVGSAGGRRPHGAFCCISGVSRWRIMCFLFKTLRRTNSQKTPERAFLWMDKVHVTQHRREMMVSASIPQRKYQPTLWFQLRDRIRSHHFETTVQTFNRGFKVVRTDSASPQS